MHSAKDMHHRAPARQPSTNHPSKRGNQPFCKCMVRCASHEKTNNEFGKKQGKTSKNTENIMKTTSYPHISSFQIGPSPPRRWPVACAVGVPHVVPSVGRSGGRASRSPASRVGSTGRPTLVLGGVGSEGRNVRARTRDLTINGTDLTSTQWHTDFYWSHPPFMSHKKHIGHVGFRELLYSPDPFLGTYTYYLNMVINHLPKWDDPPSIWPPWWKGTKAVATWPLLAVQLLDVFWGVGAWSPTDPKHMLKNRRNLRYLIDRCIYICIRIYVCIDMTYHHIVAIYIHIRTYTFVHVYSVSAHVPQTYTNNLKFMPYVDVDTEPQHREFGSLLDESDQWYW